MNDIDPDKLAAALYKLIAASMNDGQLSSVYTFNHDDDDMYFGVDGLRGLQGPGQDDHQGA